MFIKSIAITAAMLISTILTGYQQNMCINSELAVEKSITVEEKVINKESKYLKEDLKIPQLKNSDNNENIKNINDTIMNDIMPSIVEGEDISKEYYEELNQTPYYPHEIMYSYKLDLDNEKIISLHGELYEFLGGAHGLTTRYSYTNDKENNKLLKLSDLFTENYDYKTIIDKEIRNQIQKMLVQNPGMFFDNGNEFKGVTENSAYYLEEKNLVIYFQQYEIAPYASGIIEFRIPLSIFQSNFKY